MQPNQVFKNIESSAPQSTLDNIFNYIRILDTATTNTR